MEKTNHNINKIVSLVVVFCLFSLFVILAFCVLLRNGITLDYTLMNWIINDVRNDSLTPVMKIISAFGDIKCIIVVSIMAIIILKNKKDSLFIIINPITVYALNLVVKTIFQRQRPLNQLVESTGNSFPSAHAMLAIAFYGLIIYLIYQKMHNKYLKYSLIVLIIILINLTCFSRLYLGVHYFSDVLAGFSLALAYLIIFIRITYHH